MVLPALLLAAALPTPEPVATVVRVVSAQARALDEPSLDRAMRDAIQLVPSLRALSPEDLAGGIGRPLGRELRACRADTRCIASRLRTAGVAHAVLVVANLEVAPPLVSITMVRAGVAKPTVQTAFEARGPTVEGLADRFAEIFDGAGHPRGGVLRAQVQPPTAVVTLGAQVVPPDGVVVPAGRYVITATAEGYAPLEREVIVEARQTLIVDVALETTSVWSSPWPWVGIGVGVAVVGVAAGVLVANRDDSYRFCLPVGTGACER